MASRLAAAQEEMRALRTLRTGRLRVAAFPSACATLVPPALARLAETAPDLDAWLTEFEPPRARAAVLAGDVDLALLFHHPGIDNHDEHPALTIHALLDDPVLAVLPSRPRLASTAESSPGLALADLAPERWVAGCPPDGGVETFTGERCRRADPRPQSLECSLISCHFCRRTG